MIDVEDALRDMFEARAQEMSLPPSLPTSVSRGAKRRQLRNGVAVTFVVLALAVTGILGTDSMHLFRSAQRPTRGATKVELARFEGGGLSFSYPASWRPYKYELLGNQFASIVYLSNQQLHDRCVRTTSRHGAAGPCRSVLSVLPPGGVLAEWSVWGTDVFNAPSFSSQPGMNITVGGRPAKLVQTGAASCLSVIAEATMTATISIPDSPSTWYEFDACIRGPNVEAAEQQVRALLDSVVFNGG